MIDCRIWAPITRKWKTTEITNEKLQVETAIVARPSSIPSLLFSLIVVVVSPLIVMVSGCYFVLVAG